MVNASPILVHQSTDCHLFRDPDQALCGIPTTGSLREVLADAAQHGGRPHFILLTGDLTQDQSNESYRRIEEMFASLLTPVYCLPGNHDARQAMTETFGKKSGVSVSRLVLQGNWQFILLDSSLPGENRGHLRGEELDFLKDSLEKNYQHHTLVALHHNPISVGSAWMDAMTVDNASEFYRIIDNYPNVKAVLWGHVHQDHQSKLNGVLHLATPSTCLQFKPNSKVMAPDPVHPGYRWLELFPDGQIKTGVRRIKNYSFKPDMTSTGY